VSAPTGASEDVAMQALDGKAFTPGKKEGKATAASRHGFFSSGFLANFRNLNYQEGKK